MTPAACARMRRAAALLHSIPGLRATVCAGDGCAVTITPEAGHDHIHHGSDHDPDQVAPANRFDSSERPDRCHPCLFRRTIVTASAHVEVGNQVGLFGLDVGAEPTIELFAEGRCRVARNGLISWGFEDGDVVLCIATLLDPDLATDLMAAMPGVININGTNVNSTSGDGTDNGTTTTTSNGNDAKRTSAASVHPAAGPLGTTRVDLTHDEELDVTLVYAVVSGRDRDAQNAAAATLVRLMAVFGAEEIAKDPWLMAAAS